MNEIVRIGNADISIKEYKGQRVVTFKDIDAVHGRADGTARKRFADNRKHFVEGEDYFVVTPQSLENTELSEKRTIGIENVSPRGTALITEQGYLMLVKSFTDNLAWEVQRQLVKNYFGAKKPLSALEQLQLMQQATLEVSDKVDSINEDLQDFKQTLPLLAVECDRITNAVKRRGTQLLGGKQSKAYTDKSLRGRVYADIHGQVKRQFGVSTYKAIRRNQCDKAVQFINSYEIPFVLQDEIKDVNAQMNFSESEDM